MLLNIDCGEVAEHEGAGEFFLRVVVFTGEDYHGVCGADALIATTRITHYGNHSASHTSVASARGAGKDVGEDGFAHDAFTEGACEGFT